MIMRLRPKYAVLVTAVGALVLYVTFFTSRHPSAPCTSRDCELRGHVRGLVPAQPRLPQDDLEAVVVQSTTPSRDVDEPLTHDDDDDDWEKYNNGEVDDRMKLDPNADDVGRKSDLELAGNKEEYDDEYDVISRKEGRKKETEVGNMKMRVASDSQVEVSDASDPDTDPLVGLVAGMQAGRKHEEPRHEGGTRKAPQQPAQNLARRSGSILNAAPGLLQPAHDVKEHVTGNVTGNVTAPRVVRECVTGDVLGEVVGPLSLRPLSDNPLHPSATEESPKARQQSFENVFKSRAWGHGWDPSNKGLNASGNGTRNVLWGPRSNLR